MRRPTKQAVIDDVIVRRGLSYDDAIKECLRRADEAAEPYRRAASEIQGWVERLNERALKHR